MDTRIARSPPINQSSLLFGIATGMRSMTGLAALCLAGWAGRARPGWAPAGSTASRVALVLAVGEVAGDKTPFAPDRRMPASLLVRLAIGSVGGAALSGSDCSVAQGALAGALGAVVGTLAGRLFRGANTRTRLDWVRALGEDVSAVAIAGAALHLAAPAPVGLSRTH